MFVVGGESLIDLVSEPRAPGGVLRLEAHQGGSPYNCAIALAKLGMPTGFLCPISRDELGSYLMEPLAAAGVRPLLAERVAAPTTLALATINERGEARYEFYRGADRALDPAALKAALPQKLRLFQFGGFGPIEPEDAEIWADVVREVAGRGATISIDPNVRPSLISDPDGYRRRLSGFLDLAHIVKVSEEDLDWLAPGLSLEDHAARLLGRPRCELVVITLGERGSLAFGRSGRARTGIWSPPVFGDTVGAGDTLMAGVLCALEGSGALTPGRIGGLGDAELEAVLRFGAVAAGLNCGRKGCNPPSRAEVESALGAQPN